MNAQRLIVINPGSSSVKWAAVDLEDAIGEVEFQTLAIENLKTFITSDTVLNTNQIAIRFVHGGSKFFEPVLLTTSVLSQLEVFTDLAPLHNSHSIECARSILEYDPDKKVFAVFDTAFFKDLPLVAQSYALPHDLQKKHHIRRYGFHGFAHQAMLRQAQQQFEQAKKIITVQLGSGCSMAAILNGKPIDTSMGFTPSEGLLMRTRSGDIDPGLLLWLQHKEQLSPEQMLELINRKSGWEALSQSTQHFSELLSDKSEAAQLAVNVFMYRLKKQLGAYFAVLGGLDVLVLSGGIAEHSLLACYTWLKDMQHLGIELFSLQEMQILKSEENVREISTPASKVKVLVCDNGELQSIIDSFKHSKLITN